MLLFETTAIFCTYTYKYVFVFCEYVCVYVFACAYLQVGLY